MEKVSAAQKFYGLSPQSLLATMPLFKALRLAGFSNTTEQPTIFIRKSDNAGCAINVGTLEFAGVTPAGREVYGRDLDALEHFIKDDCE